MMPSGSPLSEKYVVYTVTSDESSTDVDEGHIMFRDNASPHAKDSQHNLRSFSTDISKWGPYWSKKEKCCCFWNMLLTACVVGLSVVLLCFHKDILLFDSGGVNKSDFVSSNANTISITRPPGDSSDTYNKECHTQEYVQLAAEILSRMNTTVDPCMDIYEYSCGRYSKSVPLSWDTTRIRDNPDNLQKKYRSFVIDRLSTPITQSDSPPVRVTKMAFQSCMSRPSLQSEVQSIFQDIIVKLDHRLEKENAIDRITSLVGYSVRDYGASPFFKVIVLRNGKVLVFNKFNDGLVETLRSKNYMISNFRYLMPEDFYFRDLRNDQKMIAYQKFYKEALLALLYNKNSTSAVDNLLSRIHDAVNLEFRLNRAWYYERGTNLSDDVKNCKHKSKISSLQNSYSGYKLNWKLFFSIVLQKNVTDDFELCFVKLSFEVTDVLYETNDDAIIAYIQFHMLLNTDLSTVFQGHMPRFHDDKYYDTTYPMDSESTCLQIVQSVLPLSSILIYPEVNSFKISIASIFETLKFELIKIINDLYWIPFQQRFALMNHTRDVTVTLDTETLKDNELIAFGSLQDRNNFSAIILEALKLKSQLEMKGLQSNIGFKEELSILEDWNMNIIFSSRGMQTPVWYDFPSSNALLYGSLGSFVSQALAKVFDIDALLSHFMNGIIDQEVVFTFAHHFQCLVDLFDDYFITGTDGRKYKARGDLSKAENFRDNLAMTMAFNAFKRYNILPSSICLPSLNVTDEQLFFIVYSQTFCESINTRGIQKYYIDRNSGAHLPRQIRLKATLSNFQEFSRVFKCPLNMPMNPTKRCNSL